jgi:hypothetical protein
MNTPNWNEIGPELLAACEAASVLFDAFQGSLSEQVTAAELASLHNATVEIVDAAIAKAKATP